MYAKKSWEGHRGLGIYTARSTARGALLALYRVRFVLATNWTEDEYAVSAADWQVVNRRKRTVRAVLTPTVAQLRGMQPRQQSHRFRIPFVGHLANEAAQCRCNAALVHPTGTKYYGTARLGDELELEVRALQHIPADQEITIFYGVNYAWWRMQRRYTLRVN